MSIIRVNTLRTESHQKPYLQKINLTPVPSPIYKLIILSLGGLRNCPMMYYNDLLYALMRWISPSTPCTPADNNNTRYSSYGFFGYPYIQKMPARALRDVNQMWWDSFTKV